MRTRLRYLRAGGIGDTKIKVERSGRALKIVIVQRNTPARLHANLLHKCAEKGWMLDDTRSWAEADYQPNKGTEPARQFQIQIHGACSSDSPVSLSLTLTLSPLLHHFFRRQMADGRQSMRVRGKRESGDETRAR